MMNMCPLPPPHTRFHSLHSSISTVRSASQASFFCRRVLPRRPALLGIRRQSVDVVGGGGGHGDVKLPFDDGAGQFSLKVVNPLSSGPHDVGGLPSLLNDEIDLSDRGLSFWERRTHATLVLLVSKGLITVDELRRGIEALPMDTYASSCYYTKWAASMVQILIERGIIDATELDRELGASSDASAQSPAFKTGDSVVVRREDSAVRFRKPHLRTPGYLFGAPGTIERYCGVFADPEFLAFRGDPLAKQHLYRVRFSQQILWPEQDGNNENVDTVDVEVYESWLTDPIYEDDDEVGANERSTCSRPSTHPRHDHNHTHHDHDHDHIHVSRDQAEIDSVATEVPETFGERISGVLSSLLRRNGTLTSSEVSETISAVDALGEDAQGPRIVARAWVDSTFRALLLSDAPTACAELGFSATNSTTTTVLTAVENTPDVHNLVVCTLCSCYPISILGLSPPWYKSRSYRAQAVRRPRTLLRETFGMDLSPEKTIRVHDSTADLRYIVIPERPQGTEGWSESELAKIVTRDSMIGVAHVALPDRTC